MESQNQKYENCSVTLTTGILVDNATVAYRRHGHGGWAYGPIAKTYTTDDHLWRRAIPQIDAETEDRQKTESGKFTMAG